MSQMSNFLENTLINHVLRGIPYTPPATVYVALYTSDPTDADAGAEVSGGSYARQPSTFAAPVDGATSNTADINFPVATANWGTITHVGLRDALSGGNLLLHGPLSTPRTINSGERLQWLAGELDIAFQ